MANPIETKKQQRWAILQEAKSIVENAQNENRKLTTDERQKHQKMMAEVEEMAETVEEMERIRMEEARTMKVSGGSQPEKATAAKRGPDFRSLFGENHDNGGYASLGQFLRAVASGQYDAKLQKRFQALDPGAAGGFTAPEEHGGWLFDAALESEIVRPRATVWAMNAETRRVAAFDGLDHSQNSLFGGFQAVWMNELEEGNIQDAAIRQITLQARKLAIFTGVSSELLSSGKEFEQQLTGAMSSAIAYNLDQAFLNGNGVGQPQGVFSADNDALIEVPRTGGGAIVYADIVNLYSQMHPALASGAVWVANTNVLPNLLTLQDANGSLIWSPDGARGIPATLLGRPIIFTEKVGALGTRTDLSLINFKGYVIGMRKQIEVAKSADIGFMRDAVHFRTIVRCDGCGSWNQPFTDQNGNEFSWSVTLDA
ncbi:MAG: phage major capsid protein [Bacillota bacterium]|nr:phage major capsid protein [Bacillota bacterium]MDW7677703.1 phage major capsid protein [Bacillota bacterium]